MIDLRKIDNLKKIRVLHILRSNKYSGAENVAITIIQNVERKNENIELIYVCPKGPIEQRLKKENVKYEMMRDFSIKEIKRVVKMYSPDVIHAHDFTAAFFCSLIKKKEKLIFHIHSNYDWMKRLCLKSLIFLYSAKKSDVVLTVSNSIEKDSFFKDMVKNKICMIGNPIDTDKIIEKSNEFAVDSSYDITSCGRLSPYKAPLETLYIFSKLKEKNANIKLCYIGDGELREELERKINELNLTASVELLGFKDNPYPYLKHSKVLCMPSKAEGFGLAAVEAMSLGIPVVSSSAGGLIEIVTEECGRVCTSIDEYVEEIEKLLTNEEYYKAKSTGARQRANELDNIEEYTNKIARLYGGK